METDSNAMSQLDIAHRAGAEILGTWRKTPSHFSAHDISI